MNMSLNPVFEVRIDPAYNPEDVPMTAEQYLQKVIYERERCPEVVSVPLDTSKVKEQVPCIINVVEKPLCPPHLRSTKEWQEYQVSRFAKLRHQIQILLDDDADEIESAGHLEKLLEKSVQSIEEAENFFTTVKPLLSVVLVITQDQWWEFIDFQISILNTINLKPSEKANNVVSDWLMSKVDRNNIKEWLCYWIYAGLLCIMTPLEPEMHDVLRKLAVALANVRNTWENCTFDDVSYLAVPICIIARYFGQCDLAD